MTQTNKEEVINMLTAARELQQKTGYLKGQLHSPDGKQHCMLGALGVVVPRYNINFVRCCEILEEALCKPPDYAENIVTTFNDDPATTPEDIDLIWKKAIYAVETGEVGV